METISIDSNPSLRRRPMLDMRRSLASSLLSSDLVASHCIVAVVVVVSRNGQTNFRGSPDFSDHHLPNHECNIESYRNLHDNYDRHCSSTDRHNLHFLWSCRILSNDHVCCSFLAAWHPRDPPYLDEKGHLLDAHVIREVTTNEPMNFSRPLQST